MQFSARWIEFQINNYVGSVFISVIELLKNSFAATITKHRNGWFEIYFSYLLFLNIQSKDLKHFFNLCCDMYLYLQHKSFRQLTSQYLMRLQYLLFGYPTKVYLSLYHTHYFFLFF